MRRRFFFKSTGPVPDDKLPVMDEKFSIIGEKLPISEGQRMDDNDDVPSEEWISSSTRAVFASLALIGGLRQVLRPGLPVFVRLADSADSCVDVLSDRYDIPSHIVNLFFKPFKKNFIILKTKSCEERSFSHN